MASGNNSRYNACAIILVWVELNLKFSFIKKITWKHSFYLFYSFYERIQWRKNKPFKSIKSNKIE